MKRWLVPAIFVAMLGLGLATAWSGSGSASSCVLIALIFFASAWCLMERRLVARLWFLAVILIAGIAAASVTPIFITGGTSGSGEISMASDLKKFSSYEELRNFVLESRAQHSSWRYASPPVVFKAPNAWGIPLIADAAESDFSYTIGDGTVSISKDYSTTNIQVEGVDEADIVKTDGDYLYIISGDTIIILVAYPPEEARVLSIIELTGAPQEFFVNGDKLVVFKTSLDSLNYPLGVRTPYYWVYPQETTIAIYDLSDKENPVLVSEINLSGAYFNSRMIGNYVYVVVNAPLTVDENENVALPMFSYLGEVEAIPATEIYYSDELDYPYGFTVITAINIQSLDEPREEVFLTSPSSVMYVSTSNIYLVYESREKTAIYRISIGDGEIEYKSQGVVPGRVLNQFSMDEYHGYFRIATTTGEVWGGGAKNHVYVLDEELNIVGRLEGIAPGERIYSARFMSSRVYLVTFKKIDPLFVLDLSDPHNPRVLGELKIPGYSDYLHPYDETHIIGIGKDTYDMGSFAWYQGVKIALFDVSDPENPREISKYIIGDRGTDSYALQDHRAFLFSRSRNLLVVPILLAEIDKEQYPGGVPPNTYGEYTWQGAYIFNISVEGGLVLKGRITHSEEDAQLGRWGGYYSSGSVKRSLYIENVLYTVSDNLVKMNDLRNLDEIGKIMLDPPYTIEITRSSIKELSQDGFQKDIGAELVIGVFIILLACVVALKISKAFEKRVWSSCHLSR